MKFNNETRVNWDDTEDVGIVTHYKGKAFTGICYGLHENGNLLDFLYFCYCIKNI